MRAGGHERQRETVVARHERRNWWDCIERPGCEPVKERPHEQHGGGAMLHHPVVTHGLGLIGKRRKIDGARYPERGGDTRCHPVGHQALPPDGCHRVVAGPQGVGGGVHEWSPGIDAGFLIGHSPCGHRR